MDIEFSGAAREVTGSCHLVHVGRQSIALDCGLFQGRRALTRGKNEHLPIDPRDLDAVVLSHAHIDHSGRLPLLVKRGYRGEIVATSGTRDLCAILLRDSAHIQQKDAETLARRRKDHQEPLYTPDDALRTMEQMIGLPYGKRYALLPHVHATFSEAGHILGSASVALDVEEAGVTRRLVFSGDIGRTGMDVIRDPAPPGNADAVIMECTYGNRDHAGVTNSRERLAAVVRQTATRQGRVLIPSFAVGRAQELIYDLHVLYRQGKIPHIPIFLDSPMAIDATAVFEMHRELFDRTEPLMQHTENPFEFELVQYTRDAERSNALNTLKGPAIIIAASGMAESGRILHHLAHGASDPRNTILIVGFQAEHTLGRRIVERQPTLRVFGDTVELKAQVEVLDGYSAHADRGELLAWLEQVRAQSPMLGTVYLVHGEAPGMDAFADTLRSHGYRVTCPLPGDRFTVA